MQNEIGKQSKLLQYAYEIFLLLAGLQMFLEQTQADTQALRQPLRWLIFIMGTLVVLKVILEWKSQWTAGEMLLGLLGAGTLLLCGLWQNSTNLILYALLIVGAKGMDGMRILKLYLAETVLLTVLTVSLCLAGTWADVVTYRYEDGGRMRHGLGFSYATNLTSHVLVIAMLWAYLRGEKIAWAELAMIALLGGFCYWIAEARISAACILFTAVIYGLNKWKKGRAFYVWLCARRSIKWCLIGSGCLYTGIAILLGLLYRADSKLWQKLASASSGRISMNAAAFARYSVNLLGQSISSIGELANGQRSVADYYFVLNTSYISILFRFGILGLTATLFVWGMAAWKEHKAGNAAALLLFAVFGLYCFFEHRMLEFTNNPFLLLFLTAPGCCERAEERKPAETKKIPGRCFAKTVLTCAALAFLTEAVGFNFQSVLTAVNDDISYADCTQGTPNVESTGQGTLQSTEETAVLYAYSVPSYTGLDSVFIDINCFTAGVDYSKIMEPYRVEIYDASYSLTEPVQTAEIDPEKPWTCYIPLSNSEISPNFKFVFCFGEDVQFVINDFRFNAAKPFHLVAWRMLAVFAGLCLLACLPLRHEEMPA